MHSDDLRAWVEVDLDALIENARALRARAGVPLLPMVKADAYGIGVERAAPLLDALQPWGFGVATVEEGEQLRALGIRRPILLFTPPLLSELAKIRDQTLTPALGSAEAIEAWSSVQGYPWHLAIETGMHRAGVRWDSVGSLAALIRRCPPEGAFTHFFSPEKDDGTLELQERRFREAVAALPARPRFLHAENSAAITRRGKSEFDFVRPGMFLYGCGSGAGAAIRPREVVSLHGRIVDIHELSDGDTVSYGGTYRAAGPRRIATAALGYADGYRRAFSGAGWAAINGSRVPVAGIVTMDMTMLDVTGVPCALGDVATMFGHARGGADSLEDAARSVSLSPYELMTTLKSRLPRVYRGAGRG